MPQTAKARLLRLSLGLGVVAATASGAAGCGGEGESSAPPAAGPNAVEVVDFAFEPGDLAIQAGSTVTWTNTGQEIHNVKGEGFFSEALVAGDAYEHRFARPGTYSYTCTLHPTQMRGVVTVTADG